MSTRRRKPGFFAAVGAHCALFLLKAVFKIRPSFPPGTSCLSRLCFLTYVLPTH